MINTLFSYLAPRKKLLVILNQVPGAISFLALVVMVIDMGFDQPVSIQSLFDRLYIYVFCVAVLLISARYALKAIRPQKKIIPVDLFLVALLAAIVFHYFNLLEWPLMGNQTIILLAIGFLFIREFPHLNFNVSNRNLNPAQLLIISFITIIFVGTILLLLPNATHTGISVTDALFTSTSAVCVTGLIVVDTGSYFTLFGQTVILILIQLGGLGIMTFTSYFSYFFKGSSSYESQLMLQEMTNTEKIADVFRTLKKIVWLTFIIEFIGAIIIFSTLNKQVISSYGERLYFSIFHTVSGFCNAGFSTLANSFYETGFRFNYPLHMTIASLFIIGGIGFPILFNFYKYIRFFITNKLLPFSMRKPVIHRPWVVNINTRIVILTTAVLIFSGTLLFYIFEYNNTLAEHTGLGKIATAFFGAVTPRTAGFNTVDTSALNYSTLLIVVFLMWVGASPASTGGGIKTSSLAVSVLNIFSLARGKNNIEIFRRQISEISVRRASALISLSFLMIGISIFLVHLFEQDRSLMPVVFECFSAYSTVGLSMGITGSLSTASKIVIIFTMFIGRVSMLAILVALLRRIRHQRYRYPTESILIN